MHRRMADPSTLGLRTEVWSSTSACLVAKRVAAVVLVVAVVVGVEGGELGGRLGHHWSRVCTQGVIDMKEQRGEAL